MSNYKLIIEYYEKGNKHAQNATRKCRGILG